MHLLQIPRLKALLTTVSNAIFLLLLTLMLCGFPFWGPVPWAMGGWLRPWMWQSGIYENGEDAGMITELEMIIWFWTLCRLYSEIKQVFRQGCKEQARTENWLSYFDYFGDPAQLLDMASLLMVFACALLRVGVARGQIPLPTNQFDVDALVVTQVLYGFVAILMYSRFTSVMKLSGQVGLLYVMFIKMWAEVARWFSLTLFGTLGFAVAFAVMEPGNVVAEGMLTDRPFMRPFWGLVGDFDTTTIADYYPEAGFKGMIGSISALLLWFYVFVITVVMVNLLIAQMGSAYSRLEERGPLIAHAGAPQSLQPYVPWPATLCASACNPMCQRMQPYVPAPAPVPAQVSSSCAWSTRTSTTACRRPSTCCSSPSTCSRGGCT